MTTIFTGKSLLKAYLDCRQTKRATINALKFECCLEENLATLLARLQNRTYKPDRSICFVVTAPKPREIFAAEFTDRVVHHVIINEIQSLWEKHIFIENSYACRVGKGHHFGATKMSEFAKSFKYFGQFDIHNFFASINRKILYQMIRRDLEKFNRPLWWKEELTWLIKIIIFNDPTANFYYKGDPKLRDLVPKGKSLFEQLPDTGLPIGNLTSQFFANVYLNELDHFVTEILKAPGYGRYVDDFVTFDNEKSKILEYREQMQKFLSSNLKLVLHPRKQQIQPTRHGVPFVGYFIKPWGITVRRNVVKMAKKKIYEFNEEMNAKKAVESLNSYFGHFGKAKSANLRKHLIKEHLCPELKSRVVIMGNYHHLRLRKKKLFSQTN